MLINFTAMNFLLFLLAFVVSSASFANPEFNPSAFFTAGVDYTYKAGTRGFGGGIVHLQQKDNVIHLYVKIQFLAAGTFSKTNLNEVLTTSHPTIPPTKQFFTPDIDSFTDNAILASKITNLARQIEAKYRTEYTQLHLSVEFGRDSDYLTTDELKVTDYRTYLTNLRVAVDNLHKQKNTEAIPVTIVSLPEASRSSPSEWDLYSDPRLYSHELFHIIGSMFEGYERADYPPDGIMQDMYMINAVDQFSGGRSAGTLHLADVLELLSNSFGSAKFFKPSPEHLDQLNSLIYTYAASHPTTDISRQDYLTWPPEKMTDSARQTVIKWVGHGNSCEQIYKKGGL